MDLTKKFIITINKEIGSGGRTIGERLAGRLGVNFYDKVLVRKLTARFNLSVDELEKAKAKKRSLFDDLTMASAGRYLIDKPVRRGLSEPTSENIFRVESEFLRELAAENSCVIAGRSGFYVFRHEPNTLRILIQSPLENRVKRFMRRHGVSEAEARKTIDEVDKQREIYTKNFSGTSRYDTRNYDLVLNVADMTEDEAVNVIMTYIEKV